MPRKMPAFTKPSPATLDAFAQAAASISGAEQRTMFGYPALFVNGNMMTCVFQDRIMVRLSPADRADAITSHGAKSFEPSKGRAMKEYVDLPVEILRAPRKLRVWFSRSHAFGASLPVKKPKPPKRPAKGASRKPKRSK